MDPKENEQAHAAKPKSRRGGKRETTKPKCPGTSRQTGKPCQNVLGYGTDHPGIGPCKFHGGCPPIKHGLYSKIVKAERQAIIQELLQLPDEELFTLRREMAVTKAAINEFCELTYGVTVEALPDGAKPTISGLEVLNDVNKVLIFVDLMEKASRIYERHHKIELAREGLITQKQYNQHLAAFFHLCRSERINFGNPDDLRKLEHKLQTIDITGYVLESPARDAEPSGRA